MATSHAWRRSDSIGAGPPTLPHRPTPTAALANRRPTSPPGSDQSVALASITRNRCPRVAPRAIRVANSGARFTHSAIKSPPALAQATRSVSAAAPASIINTPRTARVCHVRRGTARSPKLRGRCGLRSLSCAAMTASSTLACARELSGRSRPTARSDGALRPRSLRKVLEHAFRFTSRSAFERCDDTEIGPGGREQLCTRNKHVRGIPRQHADD